MLNYEVLRVIWWLLLGALLIGFAITDGFDLGVGALFRFLGRTDVERQTLLASIEPVWEGNQVWFILGGGAVFAAWPLLYAASFSSLYPAMFLLLVALILRPVGFTFRDQVTDERWRSLWDWALLVGGAVPALLFGVAMGNLFLGVNFHFDSLLRPVFAGSFLGLLHPFALLVGLVSLAMLCMHGATYAALKVGEPMAARARSAGQLAALLFAVSFIVAGAWLAEGVVGQVLAAPIDPFAPSDPLLKHVMLVPGGWLNNYHHLGRLWAFPVITLLGTAVTWLMLRLNRPGIGFISSALVQAATILTAGCALFPFLMPSSTNPDQGLTIWDASSSAKTLLIMLVAVIVFLPIVLVYTAWVYRVLKGKVSIEHLSGQGGSY